MRHFAKAKSHIYSGEEANFESKHNFIDLPNKGMYKELFNMILLYYILRDSYFLGPKNARQYAVVESFRHAWRGYKQHAWGHDNLKPVSGMAAEWFSLGLTIVDSLDTAFIMGLTDGRY